MSLFSRKVTLPPVQPAVTDDTEAVKEAAAREAEALRKRRGRAATILTGSQGDLSQAPTYKTILG